ncbi:MAG: hypothetical protein K2M31_01085 [Muribaculaceae bacterium]|nr:hypothetical protein [Muribaculaceae bacterium]
MDVLTYVKRNANFSTLMLGAGTVFAGTAAAAIRGNMEIMLAILCLIFVMLAQLSANFAHNYYAASKYYDNLPRPRYSVYAHDEVKNQLAVRVLREASFACAILAAVVGLGIMAISAAPYIVIGIGVLIVAFNYILNFGKNPAFGKPYTILFTWLLFGPIGVIGTSMVQCQHEATSLWSFFDHAPSLFLGPAMGFLACNVHMSYSYSMFRLDPERKSRGMTYILGPRFVEILFIINGLLMLGLIIFKVFFLDYPQPEIAIVPAFVAFALNTYIGIRMRFVPVGELQHLTMMVKVNYLLTGVVTFIVWWWIGMPDDSFRTLF